MSNETKAPQPPAEAQAQGGGEASEGWHAALDSASELVSNAPDARYRKRAEQVRDWIKAHPATPLSAPVGVERFVANIRSLAADWKVREPGDDDARHLLSLGFAAMLDSALENFDSRLNAVAQQPAAPHTCNNCEGVSPESCLFNQQPAAAGELAELVGLLDEVRSHFTRDDDLPDDLLPRIDAALAGKQGGSDNDR